jgi:hypothetical protein
MEVLVHTFFNVYTVTGIWVTPIAIETNLQSFPRMRESRSKHLPPLTDREAMSKVMTAPI